MYVILDRSNLEFGSFVWSCNYSKYVIELNNDQFKFLKRISYVTNIRITRNENISSLDSLSARNLADVVL